MQTGRNCEWMEELIKLFGLLMSVCSVNFATAKWMEPLCNNDISFMLLCVCA